MQTAIVGINSVLHCICKHWFEMEVKKNEKGRMKKKQLPEAYLKRHDQFVAFYFYCNIMLISIHISYNYCSILTANKWFIETELTS